ncbi:MFS transporter, partial [Enterobacter hormaechei]
HWAGMLLGVALWGVHMGMTQGLLAAMIAKTAPADLRGTAYGIFSLVSGVGLLVASLGAGAIWETFGAEYTFYAGAVICLVTLMYLRKTPDEAK